MPHGGLIKVEGPRILAVRQGVDVAAWGFFKPVPPALIAEDVVPPPEKPLVERGGLRFGRKAQNMVSLLAIRADISIHFAKLIPTQEGKESHFPQGFRRDRHGWRWGRAVCALS